MMDDSDGGYTIHLSKTNRMLSSSSSSSSISEGEISLSVDEVKEVQGEESEDVRSRNAVWVGTT